MILVYVICHDEKSNNIAQEEIKKQFISDVTFKIIQVSNTNPLFESQIFLYLDDHKDEWMNKKYVGIISYSFWSKTVKTDIDLSKSLGVLKESDDVDVLPLFNLQFVKRVSGIKFVPSTFYESVGILHGSNAVLLLHKICNVTMGMKDEEIKRVCDKSVPFMCNWWFAKPYCMKKYIEFFNQSYKFVQKNAFAKELIESHALYQDEKISEDQMMKIFNKPYYNMYPFIFERLPIIFFNYKNAKIKILTISNFGM